MATIPNDPLFAQQWYLLNTSGGLDLNIVDVWDDYTGAGVQVAVIDDGFDLGHADLAANFLTTIDYDYINDDTIPLPGAGENHGTAVAGIIGAVEGNGTGGVGVAFDAALVGYRNASNLTLGRAILDAAGIGNGIGNLAGTGNGSDVVNMSFGFDPQFLTDVSFSGIIGAMSDAAALGRGGLGTIFVKSGGNGRAEPGSIFREEGTAEVMDTSGFTINVGALRSDGWVTDFSTPGANLLVTAFSNDTLNQSAIATTDRTGGAGYVSGDFSAGFGGSSASAAMVSGIVALLLEANPDLGWRDVQQILALSARHVGSAVGAAANSGAPSGGGFEQPTQTNGASWFWNGGTQWNGGGLHFSNDYGFGLVDAKSAVRLAETWALQSTSANRVSIARDLLNANVALPDGVPSGRSFSVVETAGIVLEHVAVELAITADFMADLELYLTSPAGTRVQLVAGTGSGTSFDGRWSFGTTAFMGERAAGIWTVTAADAGVLDVVSLSDIVLRLGGAAQGDDDLWIFTDEFSAVAGMAGRGVDFSGGAGADTLNAAALDSASVIDLAAGNGVIDGVAVTLSSIERVVTGDGDDLLTGTAAAERLEGGRGDDVLRGNGGADALFGGRGNDVILFDAGIGAAPGALIDGGEGHDALVLGATPVADPEGAVFDFTAVDFLSIEELRFAPGDAPLSRTVLFDDQEFDASGEISPMLVVRGDDAAGATERIVITLSINQTLDLSGWVFASWGGQGERVVVNGDGSDETVVTTSQADVISSGGGNDRVVAGAGDDTIDAGTGRDTVEAGAGNDIVIDGDGLGGLESADSLDGGEGIDTLEAIATWARGDVFDLAAGLLTTATGLVQVIRNFENLVFSGSARVVGTSGANEITATGDFPSAGTLIDAGGGNDRVTTGDGADTIDGGEGRDWISAGGGDDTIFGGGAVDTVFAGSGADWVDGGDGNDVLWGGDGLDTLLGGAGNDVLNGNNGADWLDGADGHDKIFAGNGHDKLFGGLGDDTLDGGNGFDRLEGGDGIDLLLGGFGRDQLFGGIGDDRLEGGDGIDLLFGGDGADSLFGNASDDRLFGNAGDDLLNGGIGADWLEGGTDNDTLFGAQDDDVLIGGAGDDTLDGGTGLDVFLFTSDLDGNDRINRFESGIDRIEFSGLPGIGSFADLTIVAQGLGSLVTAGAVTVMLAGIAPNLMGEEDFIFS